MGLLTLLAAGIIHFILVLLDIATAFLVVRLLRKRFSWQFLEPFDRIGSPLVSYVNQRAGRRVEKALRKSFSEARLTAASLLVLVLLRTGIVLLFNALFAS